MQRATDLRVTDAAEIVVKHTRAAIVTSPARGIGKID